jgi:hypothetical protein
MSTGETSFTSLHLNSSVRWNRGSPGLGVRGLLSKHHQQSPYHVAAAPLLQALQLSTSTSAHALRDILPFTIHSPKHPEEAELQHIDTAFKQLSQDPLYQFSSLQSSPVKVTFDGLKTPDSKGLLEYASLAEEEQSLAPEGADMDGSEHDALYNYAALKDKSDDN